METEKQAITAIYISTMLFSIIYIKLKFGAVLPLAAWFLVSIISPLWMGMALVDLLLLRF